VISVSELSAAGLARTSSAFACLLFAAALWTPAARADESPEARATARKLAAEGSAAFERRDFERALSLFDQAGSLVAAPTIALMQARTLTELGRLASAAERYSAAQQTAATDASNPAFQRAAEDAERELAALKPRIPTLRVKLVGSESSSAEVTIDGRAVAPDAVSVDRWVDPGPHEVAVKTSSGASSARTIVLAEGAREEVVFSLEPAVRVPVASPPRSPSPSPLPMPQEAPSALPGAARSQTFGWVTLGTGAALTGAGTVLGVLALGHKSDLDAACDPGCPPDYQDDIDTYRLERNLSYVGFALGAAGLGAGTYLLLRGDPDGAGASVGLTVGGVRVAGRFQ
jgi:hypothetical protein